MNLLININRDDKRSLQVQIYESLRGQILKGILPAGKRLPSTRSVSVQLGIARNTVMLAYERLAAEDYITSRAKAGIFVNHKLPDATVLLRNEHSSVQSSRKLLRVGNNPSFAGSAPQLWQQKRTRPQFDFFVGRPHPSSFPTSFWQRAVARHLTYARGLQTEYGDPRGLPALREAIAAHLSETRGIHVSADQIMITSGIQGALNLIARIFLTASSQASVAIENPCYQGAAFLFASYGASMHPIDVDEQGIVVSQLEGFLGRLVYVTPSHQFPTGCTLSLDRRLHLLDWAYRTGCYVIEDDYDSDFRYDGPPLAALAGLDCNDHVIYLGTFSKSIGAGLRIGYAMLPRHLLDQARIVKTLTDNGAPWLEQAVVAEFLKEGAFLRHLRRIRRSYKGARDAVIESIETYFPGGMLLGKECGMHMMWTLPPHLPSANDMQRLGRNCGVGLYPFAGAATQEYGDPGRFRERSLVLGYTGLSEGDIREAFARVAAVVRQHS